MIYKILHGRVVGCYYKNMLNSRKRDSLLKSDKATLWEISFNNLKMDLGEVLKRKSKGNSSVPESFGI